MRINKKISKYNFTAYSNRKIEYIVIHYVGAVSTAEDNVKYFYGGDRQASAHFFVDDNSIWQSVDTKNAAWHCGGGLQGSTGHTFYQKCLNQNSIGIEMCCVKKSGKLYVTPETEKNTVWLVKKLMKEFNVPVSRIIRHWDVTGKNCPEYWTGTAKRWKDFKKSIKPETWKPKVEDKVELVSNLRVRTGAGLGCSVKKYEDLGKTAKKKCLTKKKGADAVFRKGVKVTVKEVQGSWIKIKSGWLYWKKADGKLLIKKA